MTNHARVALTTMALTGLAVAAIGFGAATVDAQPSSRWEWRGSGGWGPNSKYQRNWDSKTVTTLTGTVTAVELVTHAEGMSDGVHLTLTTSIDGKPVELSVHLGPSWYVERQDTKLAKGDAVSVTGSLITLNKQRALIASQIVKGKDTLVLRDAAGFPQWAGWRMGRGR